MERDEAMGFMIKLLKLMTKEGGSDLFITAGFPPAMKCKGKMTPFTKKALTPGDSMALTQCIMNDKQLKEFEETKECNFAIHPPGLSRFSYIKKNGGWNVRSTHLLL
jgi:twitching motility protein PilU